MTPDEVLHRLQVYSIVPSAEDAIEIARQFDAHELDLAKLRAIDVSGHMPASVFRAEPRGSGEPRDL